MAEHEKSRGRLMGGRRMHDVDEGIVVDLGSRLCDLRRSGFDLRVGEEQSRGARSCQTSEPATPGRNVVPS